jgi:hypothetical protein
MQTFSLPAVAITFVCWPQLRQSTRRAGVIVTVFLCLMGIMSGSRHNVYAWTAISLIAIAAAVIAGRIKIPRWSLAVSVVMLILAFGVYSSWVVVDRAGLSFDSEKYVDKTITHLSSRFDRSHWLVRILPNALIPAAIQGTSYFGQGYYGLALCLREEFEGVDWGLGHAPYLMRLAHAGSGETAFGGYGADVHGWFYRLIREGHITHSNWISMYPWIASDTTFVGSLLVLAGLGWLFGSSWKTALKDEDPYAAFCLLWMALTMSQSMIASTLGNIGTLVGFYSAIILFMASRLPAGRPRLRLPTRAGS